MGPVAMVVIPRSGVMLEPWKDQEIVKGWSPCVTMQETCAKEPSFITSCPKLRGSKFGGSVEIDNIISKFES